MGERIREVSDLRGADPARFPAHLTVKSHSRELVSIRGQILPCDPVITSESAAIFSPRRITSNLLRRTNKLHPPADPHSPKKSPFRRGINGDVLPFSIVSIQ